MHGIAIDALRAHLAATGARLSVEGDALTVLAPPGVLAPALRQAIRDHKPALLEAVTGFRPLDRDIAEGESDRYSLDEIEVRLARATARAADPAATAIDHQVVRDWIAIRNLKLTEERAA